MTAQLARVQAAALLAKTVFPGPVGELLHRELTSWCDVGRLWDKAGLAIAVAEDIEKRHAQMQTAG